VRVCEAYQVKKKGKITLSVTSPGKDFSFYIYEVFISPENGKQPTLLHRKRENGPHFTFTIQK
jgi:hypothetical protein